MICSFTLFLPLYQPFLRVTLDCNNYTCALDWARLSVHWPLGPSSTYRTTTLQGLPWIMNPFPYIVLHHCMGLGLGGIGVAVTSRHVAWMICVYRWSWMVYRWSYKGKSTSRQVRIWRHLDIRDESGKVLWWVSLFIWQEV